jgi:hypothetical protein
MKTYVPFFRGKQYELMAVRDLADRIAERGNIIPLIEPVKGNPSTRISLDQYVDVSMPFMFVCNPLQGEFARDENRLFAEITSEILMEYDNWIPTIQIAEGTTEDELAAFLVRYDGYALAAIYQDLPSDGSTQVMLAERMTRHVFLSGKVGTEYINSIDREQRVIISDRFNRRDRNADYPARELFTDMNTRAGNPDGVDFGDFSIVGDYYTETGGPAYAVALHHIHFKGEGGPLYVSHFISDRTETSVDTPGKTIEAVVKLVAALDAGLSPNNTDACGEYRDMARSQTYRGLGYMKKLAIKHHLEVMLDGGIQL